MQACMWYLIASEQISQVYRTISEAFPMNSWCRLS